MISKEEGLNLAGKALVANINRDLLIDKIDSLYKLENLDGDNLNVDFCLLYDFDPNPKSITVDETKPHKVFLSTTVDLKNKTVKINNKDESLLMV